MVAAVVSKYMDRCVIINIYLKLLIVLHNLVQRVIWQMLVANGA